MLHIGKDRSSVEYISMYLAINPSVNHRVNPSKPNVDDILGRVADDPVLIEALRKNFIVPPSTLPYNFSEPNVDINYDPSVGQAKIIRRILKDRKNGFYVEAGGYDGEYFSNTLYFERKLNWTGILMEANSHIYRNLTTKNRKAYISNTCLSPTNTAESFVFTDNALAGSIYDDRVQRQSIMSFVRLSPKDADGMERTLCFPLYSYMLALNRTKIDYFSLDVEGVEYDVLKNLPFDKLDIETLSVEYRVNIATQDKFLDLMKSKGYTYFIYQKETLAYDYMFVKNYSSPLAQQYGSFG